MNRQAFTLVETLMMLVALLVFSLATLAVLKKDHFSAKIILSKFTEPPPADNLDISNPRQLAKPAAQPAQADKPSAVPAPASARAGSPTPSQQAKP